MGTHRTVPCLESQARILGSSHFTCAGPKADVGVTGSGRVVESRLLPDQGIGCTHRRTVASLVTDECALICRGAGRARFISEEGVLIAQCVGNAGMKSKKGIAVPRRVVEPSLIAVECVP